MIFKLLLDFVKRVVTVKLTSQVSKINYNHFFLIVFKCFFFQEDHTLGNMIRHQLLKDPNVIFAGYKNPHPLEHKIILRVQV